MSWYPQVLRKVSSYTLAAGVALSLLVSCDHVPSGETEYEQWRNRRLSSLLEEDGWLSLIGLEWIEEGSNRIGSSPKNEVVIRSESVPRWLGVIVVDQMPSAGGENPEHAKVRFVPKPDGGVLHDGEPVLEPLALRTDAQEDTTILTSGTTQFHLIERGDRLAVRIKDSRAPALVNFEGIEYYPFDPSWRLTGQFVPHDEMLRIGDVTGFVQEIHSPGTMSFTIDGREYSLIALDGGPERYFVIFADQTNGHETYGAGRYLYTDHEDESGSIVIDFNQSYNPPCVFTDFATCPLPPRQNRLPFAIRAGEKMYAAGHQTTPEKEW